MAASLAFHPEALVEFGEAASYYLREASPTVAEAFLSAVEFAVSALVSDPTRWRVVESPEIRRYVFSRFPFVIYYRWETQHNRVTVYAVFHCSREPGCWRERVDQMH